MNETSKRMARLIDLSTLSPARIRLNHAAGGMGGTAVFAVVACAVRISKGS